MTARGLAENIPWAYTDQQGVLMWTWVTEHFVARIAGAEVSGPEEATETLTAGAGRRYVRSYHWDIADRMRTHEGVPRMLVEGGTSDFASAEKLVREHVGKLYDPRLGYRRFAGNLAFTFQISTGDLVDVSSMVGTLCTVSVLMPDGTQQTAVGTLEVSGYRWHVKRGDSITKILPEHVLSITNRSEVAERAHRAARKDLYAGVGRIYRDEPVPGCSGVAGFAPLMVDHAGAPRCPIHEEGIPEHLLR